MSAAKTSNKPAESILLHVYGPTESGFSVPGFGVYHTGIECGSGGVEYCYAGAPDAEGTGVCSQRPRQSPDEKVWTYKETLNLGSTKKTNKEIQQIISTLSAEWLAKEYNPIHHNCNHFTATVCERLGDIKYPAHINRAAKLGSLLLDNPLKDRQMKEEKRQEEERKKNNVFLNTTGHKLTSGSAANTAAASPLTNHTAISTATKGGRPNPWADPNFFPGGAAKKGSTPTARTTATK